MGPKLCSQRVTSSTSAVITTFGNGILLHNLMNALTVVQR